MCDGAIHGAVAPGRATIALDDACVVAAGVPLSGLTPTPPNPTVKASAVAPPNVAIAVLTCAFIGRSFPAGRLLQLTIRMCNYCRKEECAGHTTVG